MISKFQNGWEEFISSKFVTWIKRQYLIASSAFTKLFFIVLFVVSPTFIWLIFSKFANEYEVFLSDYYINGQLILYATALMSKTLLSTYDRKMKVNFWVFLAFIIYTFIACSYAILFVLNTSKHTPDNDFNLCWSWAVLCLSVFCLAISLLTDNRSIDVHESHANDTEKIKSKLHG